MSANAFTLSIGTKNIATVNTPCYQRILAIRNWAKFFLSAVSNSFISFACASSASDTMPSLSSS